MRFCTPIYFYRTDQAREISTTSIATESTVLSLHAMMTSAIRTYHISVRPFLSQLLLSCKHHWYWNRSSEKWGCRIVKSQSYACSYFVYANIQKISEIAKYFNLRFRMLYEFYRIRRPSSILLPNIISIFQFIFGFPI